MKSLVSQPRYLGQPAPVRRWPVRRVRVSALWERRVLLPLLALLVGIVSFSLRAINLDRSYDIFIDEITYLRIAQGVAETGQVKLYGKTFYLHPPAFFFIEAAYLRLLDLSDAMIQQVYAVRYLNAGFAALSAIALFLIGRRVAGYGAGLVAATLFALDSFIIKMNSFNLLDTSAMFWVLAGYWIIVPALDDTRVPRPLWHLLAASQLLGLLGRSRIARLFWRSVALAGTATAVLLVRHGRGSDLVEPQAGQALPWWRIVAAGVAFGLALLTKDMTAFLTILPLIGCFLFKWLLARRTAVLIGVTICLTYAAYPLTVALVGDWQNFADQKLRGLQRLSGAVKITGLNRHGGPTLLETLIARLDQFGTTYALIGVGVIAMLILLLYGSAAGRLLGLWTASAYALLAYCILFGTLEEQFFYFLVLPSLLATACAGAMLLRHGLVGGRARSVLLRTTTTLVLLFVGWSSYHWYTSHTTVDNGYEQVLSFLQEQVPADSRVAATSETAQFLLEDYKSAPFGSWHTLEELQSGAPDYLLVTPHTLAWNHGDAATPLLSWINRHGQPVFTFRGKGDSLLVLYRLPKDALAAIDVRH